MNIVVARVIVSAMKKGKVGKEVIAHYAKKLKLTEAAAKREASKLVKKAPKPKEMSRREMMIRTRRGQIT